MKKIYLFTLLASLTLSLISCSGNNASSSAPTTGTTEVASKEISYSIEVVDLDGEVLGQKSLKTKDKTSLFKDLRASFTVDYEDSQYGAMIKSINGSTVDPNYFLALYQNDKAAATGVEGIVLSDNDQIKFVNECWNAKLDETDRMIDKIIYKFMKNAKALYKDAAYGDFYLAAALYKMKENGYNAPLDIFTDEQASIINKDLKTLNAQDFIKVTTMSRLKGKDLAPVKEYLEANAFTPATGTYQMFTNALFYPAAKMAGATLPNESEYLKLFNDYVVEKGDTGAIAAHVLSYVDGFDNLAYGDIQKTTFKPLGVDAGYGVSATSTGLMILAFSTLGIDIRGDEYKIDNKDLIQILIENYLYEGYYFKERENDSFYLGSTTPQALAGLMAYKMGRDLATEGGFKKVEIFR